MKANADVVYRGLDASPSLSSIIEKKLQKLNRYSDAVLRGRVVLDSPHKHKRRGKLYRASIELDVKGAPLNVSNDHISVHVAVRDAFNAAERRLKDQAEKLRIQRH